jgi:phosphatidate cytidylyltransferase
MIIETFLRFFTLIGAGILIGYLVKGRALWTSEIGKRILGWGIVAPIYIASILVSPVLGFGVILATMLFGLIEVERMARFPKHFTGMLAILAVITAIVAHTSPYLVIGLPVLYFTVISGSGILLNDKKSFETTAVGLFTAIWIFFSLAHFELLTDLSTTMLGNTGLLVMIGFAVPLSDIGAYAIGKLTTKLGFTRTIAPVISPNKTFVGAIGNVFGAMLGIWIASFAVPGLLTPWRLIVLGAVIGIMGLFGDLTESMVKRHYKKKDSGTLIPGHGGVLDRIDSALRVVVTVYYVLLIL